MMAAYEYLHRLVETPEGVFEMRTCPIETHMGCVMRAGAEYDPDTTDCDHGVYDHHAPRSVASKIEDGEWTLDPDHHQHPDDCYGEQGVITNDD